MATIWTGANVQSTGNSIYLLGSSQSVPSASGTKLIVNQNLRQVGSTFTDNGAGSITVHAKCIATIEAEAIFTNVSDTTARELDITYTSQVLGCQVTGPAVNNTIFTVLRISTTSVFLNGDVIELFCSHFHGSPITVVGSVFVTCLGTI